VKNLKTQKSTGRSEKTSRKSDSEVETMKEQILRDAEIVAKWNKDPFYIV
jgi:archaellum component FlaC